MLKAPVMHLKGEVHVVVWGHDISNFEKCIDYSQLEQQKVRGQNKTGNGTKERRETETDVLPVSSEGCSWLVFGQLTGC